MVGIQRTGGQAPPHPPPLREQQPEQGKMMVFAGLLLVSSAFFALFPQPYSHHISLSSVEAGKQSEELKMPLLC